jgi:hypothetical protein
LDLAVTKRKPEANPRARKFFENHGLTAAIFPFQRIIGLTIRFREKDFSMAVIDPESRRQN